MSISSSKNKKQLLLTCITGLLLFGLVITQGVWVFRSAEMQEKQFNDRVDLALHEIVAAISHDKKVCLSVGKCFKNPDNKICSTQLIQQEEWQKIDRIIKKKLNYYHIELDYDFEITDANSDAGLQWTRRAYTHRMDKALKKAGISLHIEFPDRSRFILNQMGGVFISSILFIVLISISFITTLNAYRKEKLFSASVKDMVDNMTHEFKTPVANIQFAANILLKNKLVGDDSKLVKYVSIIKEENERIEKNVSEILNLTFTEGQHQSKEKIDIHQLLSEVINAHQNNPQSINLELIDNAENHFMYGVKVQLFSAFSNLIDNAIKYCCEIPDIKITTINKGKTLIVSIQDNGIGIKPEHVDLIFNKFYRISDNNVHNIKGVGLGLAYVQTICNKHDAEILVKSNSPAPGTTFSIIFKNTVN